MAAEPHTDPGSAPDASHSTHGLFGKPPDIDALTAQVQAELAAYAAAGLRMFATSSFQTNSVVLLDLLDRFAPTVPVVFLNTGYHFPETLAFRRALGKRFSLKIMDVFSPVERGQQRDADGRLLFTSDPDHCCHLNKVLPLDPIIAAHDLWISGIRGSQSDVRNSLGKESVGRGGVRRYHPLHAWDGRAVWAYIDARNLPRHPLEDEGYLSVGCRPCTRRVLDDMGPAGLDDRAGRWFGQKKTECGLHLDSTPSPHGAP